MPAILPTIAGGTNRCAFLDMLAWSEIGPALLAVSDNGYNVLVGSTAQRPLLFSDYRTHPNIVREIRKGLASSAAGRYQLLYRFWAPYTKLLKLADFGPETQDRIALQQIRERRALPLIDAGDIAGAIEACRNIWASLPGAGYGQHEHRPEDLIKVYRAAGGALKAGVA